MDIYTELKTAVCSYNEWGTRSDQCNVIYAAQRFVAAVEQRANVINQMRQTVTPTEQAIAEILTL